MGEEVPDRWCSCSSSAAIIICRASSNPDRNLFRVHVHQEDILDLRWIAEDVPHLQAQCHACYLPDEAAPYCVLWGAQLQEVLVDRCSIRHQTSTLQLTPDTIPQWASDLALEVATLSYWRKDREAGLATWDDAWAVIQEYRLQRVLNGLF